MVSVPEEFIAGDFFNGVHPGRSTWNIQITHLERKMIFQTPMIMFHVNLQGCRDGVLGFIGFVGVYRGLYGMYMGFIGEMLPSCIGMVGMGSSTTFGFIPIFSGFPLRGGMMVFYLIRDS